MLPCVSPCFPWLWPDVSVCSSQQDCCVAEGGPFERIVCLYVSTLCVSDKAEGCHTCVCACVRVCVCVYVCEGRGGGLQESFKAPLQGTEGRPLHHYLQAGLNGTL